MDEYTIGAVSRLTGYCAPTIRYFEAIGLLPPVPRSAGGRRVYRGEHMQRLAFIRNCRSFGLTQTDVRTLVDLMECPEQPCGTATAIVTHHLDRLRDQQRHLAALIAGLETAVDGCDGRAVSSCRVVRSLAAERQPEATSPPPASP
jgi:DNA-binding transcriptional MerR regulator